MICIELETRNETSHLREIPSSQKYVMKILWIAAWEMTYQLTWSTCLGMNPLFFLIACSVNSHKFGVTAATESNMLSKSQLRSKSAYITSSLSDFSPQSQVKKMRQKIATSSAEGSKKSRSRSAQKPIDSLINFRLYLQESHCLLGQFCLAKYKWEVVKQSFAIDDL